MAATDHAYRSCTERLMSLYREITFWRSIPPNLTCTNGANYDMTSESPFSFHEGPGSGSTHVPFGHSTAGMVKSPAWARYVYCPKLVKRTSPGETPNGAYRKSKEVRQCGVEGSKRKIESRPKISLNIIHEKRESIPISRKTSPPNSLISQSD